MPLASRVARHRRPLATRRATTSSTPWTPCEYLDHHRDTVTPLDTLSTTTRTRRRRRSQPWSAAGATDLEGTRHNQALPDHAVATIRLAWTHGNKMEPNEPINTKFYQLGNGGSLIFEHDLNAVSDFLGRPHPEFHGVQLDDTPGGELQWVITADLRGKMEPPTLERILFSFRESNWLDGLARGLQEALARLCGQNVVRILASRYAHLVRRDAAGVPMELQPHPELRHHAEHLDFMLYQTQKDLDASRAYANQTHAHITEQGEAIKLLNNDRKSLCQQRAKKDATIRRLRARIASLEATVKAQEDQIRQLEDDDGGIDIQGGDAFLSDLRRTRTPRRRTTSSWRQDPTTTMRMVLKTIGMAPPNRTNDAMLQLLQTMLADRETERAERQANLTALQNIANQGHGNHDHPGSKLKNFQNTNPPVFSKTEEPLDADDWLQTMENNLEVAGVEANEKVLFATHYLAGPARAWWTSTRAMNGGQFMTWEDFKLKFSKYHVPPGLIKKMRDEFRELKQGRMTVVEYRDKFLTLSRYAPDETDTIEKRKERFLNGLHDEMQTVLVNIPFADLEALVDSAIQMEGKLNQANENRKRRMANQSGSSHPQKFRPSSSGGFTPRNNKPHMQNSRLGYQNRSGGNSKPGGYNNNYNNNNNYYNRAPPRAPNNNNTNTNTAPRTGSNAVPVANKQDKTTITCYECGVVGHYSNECPKRLAKLAGNTAAPAQQQRRVSTGKKFAPNNPNNRNGRLYHMNAEEAQEAPDVVLGLEVVLGMDWMSKHNGLIDCAKKAITMTSSTGIIVEHVSEKLPRKFTCNQSVSKPTLDQIRVVCRYPDVFPDDLPGMPPDRDIEFIIELIPGTGPIAQRAYSMNAAELVELKKQIDDMLAKEFSYNNSYQASLQMAPFEALYGRKCRTPLNWSEVGESQVFGPDVLREAEEKVHKIREYLKTAQSRQKSYADKRRREMTFEIGDFVYLKMEPNEPINTKFYQLGNGGSLIFEHDLNAVSDFLGRPHPEFHGVQLDDTPGGELQWVITADLRGKMEPPTSERILFSFRESNWLDGLARGLQEALARLCGQNVVRILASRYAHLVRRDAAGVPMELQPHPELRHHAEHLDFMLYQTQKDLDASRAYANQTHAHITEQGEAIKLLNNDRKSLRQQRAKKDATIRRLRARIASLEATVKAQEDQIRQLEDDDGGIDIQGGDAFLSDDNDFEEDENTEEEDYEFLEAGPDDYVPIDVDDEE
ncbi:hypothetical protein QYE76_003320 [Lolium multiflorum]|uniref:CCHC-type domain-containing protein n=1 Tax=Lolium multiflorum TaxID=4521 RepID=A0AAD8RQ82_LOLMU|nr:hypothetical protein QYE76_003320 [Lolium multiflorum]